MWVLWQVSVHLSSAHYSEVQVIELNESSVRSQLYCHSVCCCTTKISINVHARGPPFRWLFLHCWPQQIASSAGSLAHDRSQSARVWRPVCKGPPGVFPISCGICEFNLPFPTIVGRSITHRAYRNIVKNRPYWSLKLGALVRVPLVKGLFDESGGRRGFFDVI